MCTKRLLVCCSALSLAVPIYGISPAVTSGVVRKVSGVGGVSGASEKKEVNVAVCIAGGLRQFQRSAPSLRNFLFGSVNTGDVRISAHILTWADWEDNMLWHPDISQRRPTSEQVFRDTYAGVNITSISQMSHADVMSACRSDLEKLAPKMYEHQLEKFNNREIDPKWFEAPYAQAFLFEECSKRTQDADVIVRVRPDFCFRDDYQVRWVGRDPMSQEPTLEVLGERLQLGDDKLFVAMSDMHSGFVDDTFFIGSKIAFDRALGGLRQAMVKGDHLIVDDSFNYEWGMLPEGAPWREHCPEVLVTHHIKLRGIETVPFGAGSQFRRGAREGIGALQRNPNAACPTWRS